MWYHAISVFCDVCSEQYEAFLKFNYDQISRRFGETAASCKYSQYTCIYIQEDCTFDVIRGEIEVEALNAFCCIQCILSTAVFLSLDEMIFLFAFLFWFTISVTF